MQIAGQNRGAAKVLDGGLRAVRRPAPHRLGSMSWRSPAGMSGQGTPPYGQGSQGGVLSTQCRQSYFGLSSSGGLTSSSYSAQ